MASTYSALKIELIGTGDQAGTWGSSTNVNLGTAIEEAIVGRATANFTTDADLTITLTDTSATQVARNYILNVTSGVSLTTTRNLIVPTINKPYIVENNTTGSQSIVVKTSAGTGITVPNGKTMMVYANSTNVVSAFNNLPSGTTFNGNTLNNGDVVGPASSTDNAITRFDSTTGKLIQNSSVTISDVGAIVAPEAGSVIPFYFNNQASFPSAATYHGAVAHSHSDGAMYFAHGSSWIRLLQDSGALGTPSSGTLSSCTVDGTDSVGFRNAPINSQSAAYTAVLTDSGKTILHPSADTTARVFTIPANSSVAYALGTVLTFVNQNGAGTVTIAITTDTMRLAGTGTTGSRTLAANGIASCIKLTSTEWIIGGTGLT